MPGPYWDKQFNSTKGCDPVSPGCENCWSMGWNRRFSANDSFTDVRHLPEKLGAPLHWRKPQTVFVCNTGDLFHYNIPFEFIAAMYGIMAACQQHTFLTCTKRPERRKEFFEWVQKREEDGRSMFANDTPEWRIWQMLYVSARRAGALVPPHHGGSWPLKNVWEGTTVENQDMAILRVQIAVATPAAHRWLSLEPLLEPVVIPDLDWFGQIIVGGESGSKARPCNVEWIGDIETQCEEENVSCFVKQLGSRPVWGRFSSENSTPTQARVFGGILDNHSAKPEEWPKMDSLRFKGLRQLKWGYHGKS